MKIKMMIWILEQCGSPQQLAQTCVDYGISDVTVKLLNGTNYYNWQNGLDRLLEYKAALEDKGVGFEGWGYHYLEQPGLQGERIMEVQYKLGLKHYQINVEKEFKADGAGLVFEKLVAPIKISGFYVTVCTYRFIESHPQMPWGKMNNQVQVDGWTPQVYWALNNNPVAQLSRCASQYADISTKPIYPVGPTFGQTFKVKMPDGTIKDVYWMPKNEELVAFREACAAAGYPFIYYFRLDQVIQKKWYSMLEAATGVSPSSPPPPPQPPVIPTKVTIIGLDENECLNVRSGCGTEHDAVFLTANGFRYDVLGWEYDSIGRIWYKIYDGLWIASWYTKPA